MTYEPFEIVNETAQARWLITCDHAANTVPPFVNDGHLGLAAGDMERHIAYDVGAAGVTRELARLLDAPAVLSNFSRLVIDPNRGEDDPTLLMKLYDGTIIPANRHADAQELTRRLTRCYRPYHEAVARLAARRDDTVIVSIHSYTRQLQGRPPRPWHVGILYAADTRLSRPLVNLLRAEPDLCVGENEPYGGHLPGDAIARHAIAQQRHNTLIEIRNDLIETPRDQAAWAARLAPLLTRALDHIGN
ncbi:N-formylglutamate amidohydrolase [Lutimaribacter sp. EGI FJ00015]|uniref:N-formylglutamate amidohydrolase n=1 Tax=Lutimaribacter degradans TaxID=2945989 RepID=A0ACC5ZVI6_9RHOB|nr:N-formylglutamate amidohydrolase [Lutimaribacter sp. EGI FJ00013]MCM2562198.1 N-formylglutamate amidohydrolase [Lutimaribacter sp. EGI FJ00013]MCO0613353.1 N-formylglutamate amidohydrolase [Lutimaribacter sp. EGI FJ00015]MCO0636327.1 N-formylglutamate amidohydrolase [Lutimaribacter sp. EGI FJ00014]